MKITKTAVVSVVGRPNVGKSTLTNKLVGQKVAIVSSKPQTTRTRITGLLNRNGTQYVFLDTPGLHKPRTQLGDYMCKVVTDTVSEVDAAMLVVEPIANIGPAEESLIAQIKAHRMPAVLVINKIDTVKKEELLNVIATYAAAHEFEAVVPDLRAHGRGSGRPAGRAFDSTPSRARSCSRRIWSPTSRSASSSRRSSARRCSACSTARFRTAWLSASSAGTSARTVSIEINAVIYCEKASHKGIIIGKQGAMLQRDRQAGARATSSACSTRRSISSCGSRSRRAGATTSIRCATSATRSSNPWPR